jgi:hypothetical protein
MAGQRQDDLRVAAGAAVKPRQVSGLVQSGCGGCRGGLMGQIIQVQVQYLAEAPDGAHLVTVDLAAMNRYCRPERVEDLVEDLGLICEDVFSSCAPMAAGRSGPAAGDDPGDYAAG